MEALGKGSKSRKTVADYAPKLGLAPCTPCLPDSTQEHHHGLLASQTVNNLTQGGS